MIYVDSRGSGEKEIAEILSNKKYPVTIQHIESGDFVLGDLAIERKTVSDLVNSVISKEKGHNFWDQLKVMKDTYKKVIVVIEGPIDWEDRLLAGIIYGIVDGWQIPYINTMNKEGTAKRIGQLHDRYGSTKTAKLPPVAVKKGYTVQEIRWMMLQCIPHLGGVVAKRVLDSVPLFTDTYFECHPEELEEYLSEVKGLNKDSKEYILKVFGNKKTVH